MAQFGPGRTHLSPTSPQGVFCKTVFVPAHRSRSLAAPWPPDGLAGQDELRRPPAATSTSAGRRPNPNPPFLPFPVAPKPQKSLTLTLLPAGLRPIPAPARFPGRRRPRHRARGELLDLPLTSPCSLSLPSITAPHHLPRHRSDMAAGHAPATNQGRRRLLQVPRVALLRFPLTRAEIAGQIGRLQSGRAPP
jgi:hypothetical protein